MASTLLVQPDTEFIHRVVAAGGGGLKKCFQCATCSSVCSLSGAGSPFPRKQMIEAQWGLKNRLMADPAVWLCYNCGDCTSKCPRDARPGQVMAAIRTEFIKRFAFPRFMGSLVSSPKALPLLLALPILILYAIAVWPLRSGAASAWEFAFLFPQSRLEALFFTVSGLVLAVFVAGVIQFLGALRASGANGAILPALGPVLAEILTHRRFSQCSTEKERYWGHLLVFSGFVGLAIMGTVVGIGTMIGVMHTPLAILSPLKIFANVCALAALAGCVILIAGRIQDREARSSGTYFDWFFLLVLAAAVFTGILSEVLRLAQYQTWMYAIYFFHLTLILALFLYAPYSKFAHFVYRTVALAATWEGEKQPTATQDSVRTDTLADNSA
ncbi:MAG TPA: quinone-interacting membrane-bound oxidoreductase complex subunit QmoC [Candidatus Acidoferrum sp.]|nr:quinone-interacting membrane-bound oxidoreductase complex subunit QmoC [Candidatus Acidoferrum sp.]